MKPTNKLLGACGMIAAPFMSFQMLSGQAANADNTSLGGLFDLIYMLGWMCSIFGLLQLRATGTKRKNAVILYIQLALLFVANIWNIWVIFDPLNSSTLFFLLDMFWPLSNVFMLVVGIVTAVKGVLKGWRRYIVLMVSLWLPFALATSLLLGRDNNYSFYPGCAYSFIAWLLMGWMIYSSEPTQAKQIGLAI